MYAAVRYGVTPRNVKNSDAESEDVCCVEVGDSGSTRVVDSGFKAILRLINSIDPKYES